MFSLLTCLSNCHFCSSPDADDYQDDSLTSVVMRMWIKRRHLLVHDYSLVGYLLAPHPSIMDHCMMNKTLKHVDAAERLVEKLLLNPALFGMDKEREKARLINTFHSEYRDFSCHMGHFARIHIWVSAEDPLEKAFRWHQNYSLLYTEVLGRLACLVTSKILGIGTAERNWKQVKAVKSGQRTNTGVLKAKYQVMIYSQYQQMKAQTRITRMSCAGKLWTDDDFKCCKMDDFCGDIEANLAREKAARDNEVRNFRAWQEQWEKKKLGPNGNKIFEARLLRKYGGIKFVDIDTTPHRVFKVHPSTMWFEKERGNNHYSVVGILDGFDLEKPLDQEDNKPLYEPWDTSVDFYECVKMYYEGSTEVRCLTKDDCDSDEE